jgi:hypothetical protein
MSERERRSLEPMERTPLSLGPRQRPRTGRSVAREKVDVVRRQVGRVLVAVAAVGVVVSGCGSGPSQVGSAAIVGSTAVPLDQVQSRLDAALAKPDVVAQLAQSGVGPPEIARDVVTRSVLHDLLARTAAAENIVVSEADVDAVLGQRGGVDAALAQTLYDLPTLRERVRDQIIATRYAERVVPGLTVTADLVAATSRDDAAEKARILNAGGPAADALFADPEISRRGVSYQAESSPEAASTVLFGLPEGRTAYFQPSSQQSGWIVLRVTDRSAAPDAPADALASVGGAELAAIGERLLQPLSEEVGVRVNPRYGVWDPVAMRVVPADAVTGAVLPPAAA